MMQTEHHRRSIRFKSYDYSRGGAYFVTVCARDRACLFGDVVGGHMQLNEAGSIVQTVWDELPAHFTFVELDEFVVMPNHIHGIIILSDRRGTACRAPTTEQFGKPVAGSIPTIVRSFKSAATKRINQSRTAPGTPVWQRNYYEHIVRNDESLNRIREYIIANPSQWAMDRENPANVLPDGVGASHVTSPQGVNDVVGSRHAVTLQRGCARAQGVARGEHDGE